MIGEKLWIAHGDGAAAAHRIVVAGKPRLVEVGGKRRRAVAVRLLGDGGMRTVPVSDLTDAAPLSPAEEREYDHLDAQLAGTFGEADTLRRFNALRLRSLLFGKVEA